jgi:membrane-bound ClpP family serine protease
MLTGLILIIVSLSCLIWGIVKKNRGLVIGSIIALLVIGVLYAVYSYLYSQNPY